MVSCPVAEYTHPSPVVRSSTSTRPRSVVTTRARAVLVVGAVGVRVGTTDGCAALEGCRREGRQRALELGACHRLTGAAHLPGMSVDTPAGAEPLNDEPTPADDLVHGATWDGTAPTDLGGGRREYRCHDGSSFVTDPAERITLDVAQSEHILGALMAAAMLPDRLDEAA